jgi:hypothetical protein
VVVDGDVNEFPGTNASHVAVAVKVHDNDNVYDNADRHFRIGNWLERRKVGPVCSR